MSRKTTSSQKKTRRSRQSTEENIQGFSGLSGSGIPRSASDISGLSGGMRWGKNKRGVMLSMVSHPAFKYVAGGIATAVLTKVITNLSEKYPELSNFLQENLNTIEEKLTEYRNTAGESERESRYS